MRADGDEHRKSNAGVGSIPYETFAEASDNVIALLEIEERLVRSEMDAGMGDAVGRPKQKGMT